MRKSARHVAGCRGRLKSRPILTFSEVADITAGFPESLDYIEEILAPSGQYYYVLRWAGDAGRCYFLDQCNNCRAKKLMPLYCQSYPFSAVYNYGVVKLVADCQAAEQSLHFRVRRSCKQLARQSIARFHRETYRHWQEVNAQ